MDPALVILAIVCLNSLIGLAVALRRYRFGARGWALKYGAILVLGLAGWIWQQNAVIYLAGGVWFGLALLPGLISLKYHQLFLQQRYAAAYRAARFISWLHPLDGWRIQPRIVRAVELAHRNEMAAATAMLQHYQDPASVLGFVALATLFRLTNRWEEFLVWQRQHPEWERYPEFLQAFLRARGETGDVVGLIRLYDRHQARIARLNPASHRDLCRLMLFAFSGKREMVAQLFRGSLAILPQPTQQFWLATAELAAGSADLAREQFELLLPVADAPLQVAIQRRLAQLDSPALVLEAEAESVIRFAALEQGQEERFGTARRIFSKQARASQAFIGLNLFVFVGEILLGGSTDLDVLFRMGALFPPAVVAGEWWRIVAALFLHFGPLHLFMNMLALAVLGPFIEFAFGRLRFLLLYLLTGLGSMLFVCAFASGPTGEQLTVGASGCVMGLVGATGALMLRGWRRERAQIARRRLIVVIAIILSQTCFDAIIPQVSMAGHLSGAVLGFALALALNDRLNPPLPNPAPR